MRVYQVRYTTWFVPQHEGGESASITNHDTLTAADADEAIWKIRKAVLKEYPDIRPDDPCEPHFRVARVEIISVEHENTLTK